MSQHHHEPDPTVWMKRISLITFLVDDAKSFRTSMHLDMIKKAQFEDFERIGFGGYGVCEIFDEILDTENDKNHDHGTVNNISEFGNNNNIDTSGPKVGTVDSRLAQSGSGGSHSESHIHSRRSIVPNGFQPILPLITQALTKKNDQNNLSRLVFFVTSYLNTLVNRLVELETENLHFRLMPCGLLDLGERMRRGDGNYGIRKTPMGKNGSIGSLKKPKANSMTNNECNTNYGGGRKDCDGIGALHTGDSGKDWSLLQPWILRALQTGALGLWRSLGNTGNNCDLGHSNTNSNHYSSTPTANQRSGSHGPTQSSNLLHQDKQVERKRDTLFKKLHDKNPRETIQLLKKIYDIDPRLLTPLQRDNLLQHQRKHQPDIFLQNHLFYRHFQRHGHFQRHESESDMINQIHPLLLHHRNYQRHESDLVNQIHPLLLHPLQPDTCPTPAIRFIYPKQQLKLTSTSYSKRVEEFGGKHNKPKIYGNWEKIGFKLFDTVKAGRMGWDATMGFELEDFGLEGWLENFTSSGNSSGSANVIRFCPLNEPQYRKGQGVQKNYSQVTANNSIQELQTLMGRSSLEEKSSLGSRETQKSSLVGELEQIDSTIDNSKDTSKDNSNQDQPSKKLNTMHHSKTFPPCLEYTHRLQLLGWILEAQCRSCVCHNSLPAGLPIGLLQQNVLLGPRKQGLPPKDHLYSQCADEQSSVSEQSGSLQKSLPQKSKKDSGRNEININGITTDPSSNVYAQTLHHLNQADPNRVDPSYFYAGVSLYDFFLFVLADSRGAWEFQSEFDKSIDRCHKSTGSKVIDILDMMRHQGKLRSIDDKSYFVGNRERRERRNGNAENRHVRNARSVDVVATGVFVSELSDSRSSEISPPARFSDKIFSNQDARRESSHVNGSPKSLKDSQKILKLQSKRNPELIQQSQKKNPGTDEKIKVPTLDQMLELMTATDCDQAIERRKEENHTTTSPREAKRGEPHLQSDLASPIILRNLEENQSKFRESARIISRSLAHIGLGEWKEL